MNRRKRWKGDLLKRQSAFGFFFSWQVVKHSRSPAGSVTSLQCAVDGPSINFTRIQTAAHKWSMLCPELGVSYENSSMESCYTKANQVPQNHLLLLPVAAQSFKEKPTSQCFSLNAGIWIWDFWHAEVVLCQHAKLVPKPLPAEVAIHHWSNWVGIVYSN